MNPEDNNPSSQDQSGIPPQNSVPDASAPTPESSSGGSEITPGPEQPAPAPTVQTSSPPPSKLLRNLLIAVLAIIVVGGAIAMALHLVNQNKSSLPPNEYPVASLGIGTTEPFATAYYPNIPTDIVSTDVSSQAFEGLTEFVNETQVAPDLASSWTNPNSSTWIFNIKQGVKFHDGRELTSKQVAASLMQIKNYPVGQEVPYTIKSVTPEGQFTVKITTLQPDPLLTRELTQFWIWDTDSTVKNNPIDGTGPYVLAPGTKLTSSSVHFVAYNNYHGGKPSVKALSYYEYSSGASLVNGLKQNKIDIADLSTWPAYAPKATAAGLKLYNQSLPLVYYLIPNTLKVGSPLANLKVRQAIYMTLNPTAIAKAHNGDVGLPATQIVPASIPGYNPSIKRPAIDPTAAKALLAQAGYPNGFTISILYDTPSQDGVAKVIQQELAAIGITLTLNPQSSVDVLGGDVESGNVDLYLEGDNSTIIDTSDVAATFAIDTPEFKNAQVDSLFDQAQQTFNTTARLKLLMQLNAAIMNNLAVFPTYIPANQYFAYRPGLVLQQQSLGTLSGLYYWQIYANKPNVN